MAYYNTNKETGDTLKESWKITEYQDGVVLKYFQEHADKNLAPHIVWKEVFSDHVPLTSVRRAITNLTQDGFLEKTEEMQDGCYGKKCHTWRLRAVQV